MQKRTPFINHKRTQQELFDDVAFVLSKYNKLSEAAVYRVLDDITWKWTTINGKYAGCECWSAKAINKYKKLKSKKTKFKWGDYFIHEHVVPRIHIIELLMAKYNPSYEYVSEVMHELLNGAVILKGEDRKLNSLGLRSEMPETFYNTDNDEDYLHPWLRYKVAKIKIHVCTWDNKKNLISHHEMK